MAELEEGVAELARPSLSIFSSGRGLATRGGDTTRAPASPTYNVLYFSRRGVMYVCAECYFNQVSFLLLILTLLLSKHHFNIVQITFLLLTVAGAAQSITFSSAAAVQLLFSFKS